MKSDADGVKWIHTLKTQAEDFEETRDWIKCFPAEEMIPIHIESVGGSEAAAAALVCLGLRGRLLEELNLHHVWLRCDRKTRLMHLQADLPDQDYVELANCYDLIIGHIKWLKREEYEAA